MTGIPAWATWGLLGAWAVHDLEEAITMPGWTQRIADDLDRRGLAVVGHLVRRTPHEVGTAITLIGVPFAVAAIEGRRTGGRSSLYQGALLAFGLHAITHVGASVAMRRYTPGLATTPVAVAAFSVAVTRELLSRGVPFHPAASAVTLAIGAWVPVSHVLARRLLRYRFRSPIFRP